MVKVSPGEKAGFMEVSERKGLTLSAWARMVLRAAGEQEYEAVGEVAPWRK